MTSTKYQSLEKCIPRIADLGYDGVALLAWEPHIEPSTMTNDDIQNLKELIDSSGLEVTQIAGGEGPVGDPLPNIRDAVDKNVMERLDFAAKIGAHCYEPVPGMQRQDWTVEKSWNMAVEACKRWSKYAEDVGVPIAVEYEPMTFSMWGKPPLHFNVWSLETLKRFIDEVDSPYCKANVDIGHCFVSESQGERVMEHLDDLKGYVIHTHCNDNTGNEDENLVPGEGKAPLNNYVKKLYDNGYDGYICVELEGIWGPATPDWSAKQAFLHMKDMMTKMGLYGTYTNPFKKSRS